MNQDFIVGEFAVGIVVAYEVRFTVISFTEGHRLLVEFVSMVLHGLEGAFTAPIHDGLTYPHNVFGK